MMPNLKTAELLSMIIIIISSSSRAIPCYIRQNFFFQSRTPMLSTIIIGSNMKQ